MTMLTLMIGALISPGWGTAREATFLWDVWEPCRQDGVNRRPAGSREGYVWLPKWISRSNFFEFVLRVHLDPRQIGSTNQGLPVAGPTKMPHSISVDQYMQYGLVRPTELGFRFLNDLQAAFLPATV